jgi:hypothetical protein
MAYSKDERKKHSKPGLTPAQARKKKAKDDAKAAAKRRDEAAAKRQRIKKMAINKRKRQEEKYMTTTQIVERFKAEAYGGSMLEEYRRKNPGITTSD